VTAAFPATSMPLGRGLLHRRVSRAVLPAATGFVGRACLPGLRAALRSPSPPPPRAVDDTGVGGPRRPAPNRPPAAAALGRGGWTVVTAASPGLEWRGDRAAVLASERGLGCDSSGAPPAIASLHSCIHSLECPPALPPVRACPLPQGRRDLAHRGRATPAALAASTLPAVVSGRPPPATGAPPHTGEAGSVDGTCTPGAAGPAITRLPTDPGRRPPAGRPRFGQAPSPRPAPVAAPKGAPAAACPSLEAPSGVALACTPPSPPEMQSTRLQFVSGRPRGQCGPRRGPRSSPLRPSKRTALASRACAHV
jgi:hypothetical protein